MLWTHTNLILQASAGGGFPSFPGNQGVCFFLSCLSMLVISQWRICPTNTTGEIHTIFTIGFQSLSTGSNASTFKEISFFYINLLKEIWTLEEILNEIETFKDFFFNEKKVLENI